MKRSNDKKAEDESLPWPETSWKVEAISSFVHCYPIWSSDSIVLYLPQNDAQARLNLSSNLWDISIPHTCVLLHKHLCGPFSLANSKVNWARSFKRTKVSWDCSAKTNLVIWSSNSDGLSIEHYPHSLCHRWTTWSSKSTCDRSSRSWRQGEGISSRDSAMRKRRDDKRANKRTIRGSSKLQNISRWSSHYDLLSLYLYIIWWDQIGIWASWKDKRG